MNPTKTHNEAHLMRHYSSLIRWQCNVPYTFLDKVMNTIKIPWNYNNCYHNRQFRKFPKINNTDTAIKLHEGEWIRIPHMFGLRKARYTEGPLDALYNAKDNNEYKILEEAIAEKNKNGIPMMTFNPNHEEAINIYTSLSPQERGVACHIFSSNIEAAKLLYQDASNEYRGSGSHFKMNEKGLRNIQERIERNIQERIERNRQEPRRVAKSNIEVEEEWKVFVKEKKNEERY